MNALNISDLALHHGAVQKTSELTALIEFIRPLSLGTVVEIGTRRGGTLLLWMLTALDDALLVSIDLPFGPFGGGDFTEDIKGAARFLRPRQQLLLIRRDSHSSETHAELGKVLQSRQVDLLFIDGDHTYEGVKQDFQMYSQFVRPGGLIVFHDILPHPRFPTCQVDRFWQEVKVGRPFKEFVDADHNLGYGPWGGIGVIRWDRQ